MESSLNHSIYLLKRKRKRDVLHWDVIVIVIVLYLFIYLLLCYVMCLDYLICFK